MIMNVCRGKSTSESRHPSRMLNEYCCCAMFEIWRTLYKHNKHPIPLGLQDWSWREIIWKNASLIPQAHTRRSFFNFFARRVLHCSVRVKDWRIAGSAVANQKSWVVPYCGYGNFSAVFPFHGYVHVDISGPVRTCDIIMLFPSEKYIDRPEYRMPSMMMWWCAGASLYKSPA